MDRCRIIVIIYSLLLLYVSGYGREPSIYYTTDAKKIERIEGANLNTRMEFKTQRREGWMVLGTSRFSCNGYIPQESFISFGGKKTTYQIHGQPFLGFGLGRQSEERKVYFDDISYIIPGAAFNAPMRAVLNSGEKGYLFLNNRPLYSRTSKKDSSVEESGVYILKLKPKRAGVQGELKQEIIKCRCIAFSRQGVQEAIKNDFDF